MATKGSKTSPVSTADDVAQKLAALQERFGADAVEAARLMLGISKTELEKKDESEFKNKYEEQLADPNPIRQEYLPVQISPRLRQKKSEMWQIKRGLHVDEIEKALVGHCTAPFPRLKPRTIEKILIASKKGPTRPGRENTQSAGRAVSVGKPGASKGAVSEGQAGMRLFV